MTKKLVGYLLAAALLAALVVMTDLRSLWETLAKLRLDAFAFLMLISLLLIYISALKWKLFVDTFERKLSVFRLVRLYLVGYFVNLIVPSHLGGDAVRSWYVGRDIGQAQAFSATVLERYTGMVAMLALALGMVWFVDAATPEIEATIVLLALALAGGTVLAMSRLPFTVGARFPRSQKILERLKKVQGALAFASSHKRLMGETLALSFLYHSVTVVNTVAAGYAIGWTTIPILDLFVVLPIILLVGSLPLTPQGLGIQEGAFFYFLSSVGATPSQALAVALVLRAKSYVLAILGGICWGAERRRAGSSGS